MNGGTVRFRGGRFNLDPSDNGGVSNLLQLALSSRTTLSADLWSALWNDLSDSLSSQRRECHLDAQYPSNRPRTPFTNRSNIARKTRANDAPAIAPGEDGTQGLKKRWSPPPPWKYGIIWDECPVGVTPLDEVVPELPSWLSELMLNDPQDRPVLLAGSTIG